MKSYKFLAAITAAAMISTITPTMIFAQEQEEKSENSSQTSDEYSFYETKSGLSVNCFQQ